jgi:hypothetical protein
VKTARKAWIIAATVLVLLGCLTVPSLVNRWKVAALDKKAIEATYTKFRECLLRGDGEGAYNLCAPEYQRQTFPRSVLIRFADLTESRYQLHPNRYLRIYGNRAKLFAPNTKESWTGRGVAFIKINGIWYVDDVGVIFVK